MSNDTSFVVLLAIVAVPSRDTSVRSREIRRPRRATTPQPTAASPSPSDEPLCAGCNHWKNLHGGNESGPCQGHNCRCGGWASKLHQVSCRGCGHPATFHVLGGACAALGCPGRCSQLHAPKVGRAA